MNIIINTSNLYVGGGVQVAISFINELRKLESNNQYHIFLSKSLDSQLEQSLFDNKFNFYLIEDSPAKLLSRKKMIKKMDDLERKINPDIVFTIFGPSYWTPKSKHLMGFAIPWVLEQDSIAYSELKLISRLKTRLRVKYISFYSKKNTNKYIIETDDGKKKLSNILNIDKKNIYVVGNTYSSVFNDKFFLNKLNNCYVSLSPRSKNEYRLLLISHNYPHKNLKIIVKILPLIKKYNVKFVLTITQNDYKSLFGSNNENIINLGPVKQISCPSIYSQCDATFLPSLLEVFSAAYPESMKMKKPILTSDLSFAHDICGDAAIYFNPLDENDIANKIIDLIENKKLKDKLITNGINRLETFESASSRTIKYLKICEKIIFENNSI